MSIGIFSNSGNDVRLLKDQLDLNGTAKVLTGTDDPRSVAKNAPQGSIYLQTGATGGKVFKKLDAGSSTNWSEVGSGAGGINYILNHDAEAGTTGWATYADTAAATPVDGTGGSPTVTFTTSSSSPLRGNNSFLITKDAANRQGEGASYAFSIDTADRASVMAIEFDYAVASGTFAAGDSSDIRVFVYDVTNSQLITPVAHTIQSNTQSKYKGLFQSNSNSTSYRLILHVATTSASAYTFKLDNVRVGPQTVVFGGIESDWKDYSATVTIPSAAYGTISQLEYWVKRVGDMAHVRGKFKCGTVAAQPATMVLPAGLSIDTAKFTANATAGAEACHLIGQYAALASAGTALGSTDNLGHVFYDDSNTTMYFTNNASGFEYLVRNVSAFINNNDVITFNFAVPILGWSSLVQVSDSTETRIVAARYTTNAGQSIPNATVTIVDFEDKIYDTHNLVTVGASWKFTAAISGYYRVTARVGWSTMSTTNNYNVYVYKNGSVYSRVSSSGDSPIILIADTILLSPGDFIDIRTDQDTGGAVTLSSSTQDIGVTIERISGPSAIAANELVAAVYKDVGTTLADGVSTIIQYDTKVFDTHGVVTTGASWKFTAPVAGTYSVSGCAQTEAAGTGERYVEVFKNGVVYARGTQHLANASFRNGEMVSTLVQMVPGDYIDIRMFQSSGVSRVTEANNQTIAIHRVGF